MKNGKGKMSRKEFLKRSSTAFLGLGILGLGGKTNRAMGSSQSAPALVKLGNTGIDVSVIGFGASRTMEPALVQASLDSGVNFLDTGRSYFNGQNEIMIGKVVSSIRKEVVIQSKLRVSLPDREGGFPSAEDVQKTIAGMTASMEASLKALGTDYIDIMLIHGAESVQTIHHEAVMGFFEKAKEQGKIRAHGFSVHANQVELLRAANAKNFYEVIMVPFNHKGSFIHMNSGRFSEWDQPALESEMKKAKERGAGMIAMKTCSGGAYAPDEKTEPSFEHALRWIIARGRVHSMAVAMGNFEQVEENLRALR